MTEYDDDACRNLWQRVLLLAIIDGLSPVRMMALGRDGPATRAWIVNAGEDFATVCHLADVDPAYMRDKFLAIERSGGEFTWV